MAYKELMCGLVLLFVVFQTGETAVTITTPANNDATIWLPEDIAVNTAFYTLAVTSSTGATVTYTTLTIDGTNAAAGTMTVSAAGVLTVTGASVFDYETAPTANVLKLDVNDGGTAVTATVTVSVLDVPVFMPSQVFCVADGSVAGAEVTTVSTLGTTTATRTYALSTAAAQDANSTDFTLATGGALTVATGKTLSAQNDGSYSLLITATEGAETSLGTVVVGVGCGGSSGSSAVIAGSMLTLVALVLASLE